MATLSVFKISIIGSTTGVTNNLYANGNQQCKVAIDVLKLNNSYQKEDLTAAEINSLTVLPYSDQLFPSQAPGWSCDKDKNRYDEGTRGTALSAAIETAPSVTESEASTANDVPQQFYRYMKTDRTGAQRFMACIEIGGQKYSTHYNGAGGMFESYVEIAPKLPYTLVVDELKLGIVQQWIVKDKLQVKVHYWELPDGLKVLDQSFSNAGWSNSKLEWSFCEKPGWLHMGVAVKPHVTSLTVGDIDGGLPAQYWNLPVDLRSTVFALRAVWYHTDLSGNAGRYNKTLRWAITDSYGCSSAFNFIGADRWETLKLENAPVTAAESDAPRTKKAV